MRYRQLLIPTLREDPTDAEVASHRLLVRAGMIRQVARGIYDFLPLGLRVVQRVERIVREEMDRAGAQEILMPTLCPAELWLESGRWAEYGKELLRITDRNDRPFCYAPTHEEVVTEIVRRDVRSYRELPLNLYQIQVKFRDEVRPRFGLIRGREFIMKDAYSFHADAADCRREYQNMFDAYSRIFSRCGLRFRAVEADPGAIGGSLSHEFHVLADAGEDAIVSCGRCGYAANVELAGIRPHRADGGGPGGQLRKVHTPGQRTVEEVASFLGASRNRFIKTLVYQSDTGEVVAALARGDHEMSEAKLRVACGCRWLALADAETVERATGAPVGFAGPVGLAGIRVVADHAVRGMRGAVTGANEADYHLTGVDQERDFGTVEFADLRRAGGGDPCPRCEEGEFEEHRGIEVGHVFYLGDKYSRSMRATFLDATGRERFFEMGCYGIGVTRTVAAAVEQNHDDRGIIWPLALAPFPLLVLPVNWSEVRLREAAEELERAFTAAGIEVLLDDREERAGVKFADADLLGIPLRITVGGRALGRGKVELKGRCEAQPSEVGVDEAVARVAARLRGEEGR